MRDKVLAVIGRYAEGCTVRQALKAEGVTWFLFYKTLRAEPELENAYYSHQRDRADMAGDEILGLADRLLNPMRDENGVPINPIDARNARVAGDLLGDFQERYDPDRFGQRTNLRVEAKPDLLAAIEAGKQRAASPIRHLDAVDAIIAPSIEPFLLGRATDKQSVATTPATADAPIDPFE